MPSFSYPTLVWMMCLGGCEGFKQATSLSEIERNVKEIDRAILSLQAQLNPGGSCAIPFTVPQVMANISQHRKQDRQAIRQIYPDSAPQPTMMRQNPATFYSWYQTTGDSEKPPVTPNPVNAFRKDKK